MVVETIDALMNNGRPEHKVATIVNRSSGEFRHCEPPIPALMDYSPSCFYAFTKHLKQ